ncbi:hypothetical protein ACWIGI_01530 [Nocardia sp. NPDC055321]
MSTQPTPSGENQTPPSSPESIVYPLFVLAVSAGFGTLAGILSDWSTAVMVFVSVTALFDGARRSAS